MRTIAIRVAQTADFSAKMVELRSWFDRRGCEPSRFRYDQRAEGTVIQILFDKDGEAEAFKTSFGGEEIGLQAPGAGQGASSLFPLSRA
jgi:hypothetical protein